MSVANTSNSEENRRTSPPPRSYIRAEPEPLELLSESSQTRYQQPLQGHSSRQAPQHQAPQTYLPGPPIVHPLDYSERHPSAPIRHIVRQPELSTTSLQESPFQFKAGSAYSRQSEDAPPLVPRRQAKKIGQRREMHNDNHARLKQSDPSSSRFLERDANQGSRNSEQEPGLKTMSKEAPPSTRTTSSRPMQISELIGEDKPVNEYISNRSRGLPEPRYTIKLRQEPIAARACGFGERDRRVIDPPPILQMTVNEPGASSEELSTKLRWPFSVVHCELWNAETDNEETAMPGVGERRQQRRLMGTLVASPFVGRDEFDEEGCFFCFPDLSCRTPGTYRLRFILIVLDPSAMAPGDKASFRATAMSQPFQVYAAKDFPGMEPSTELTKRLKEQGCLIQVKKGNTKSSASHSRLDDDEDDDDDDNAEPSAKAKAKRVRR